MIDKNLLYYSINTSIFFIANMMNFIKIFYSLLIINTDNDKFHI